jgi:hypothetical protein
VPHSYCVKEPNSGEAPKALITKDKTETSYLASLMIEGIVISLEILVIGMGDRGSKSDNYPYL